MSRWAFLFPLNSSSNSCRPRESVFVLKVCVCAHTSRGVTGERTVLLASKWLMQLRNPSYSLPPLLLSPPPEYRIDRGSANSVCRDQPCVTGAPSRTANFPVHQQASAISTASAWARERVRERETEKAATAQSVRNREIIRPHDASLTSLWPIVSV